MTDPKSIDRLKELLFDRESREIDALAQRIDGLGANERRERGELSRRLDALADRTGGDDQLRRGVLPVADVSGAVDAQAERRAVERARRRLEHLASDLRRRLDQMPEGVARAEIAATAAAAEATARDLAAPLAPGSAPDAAAQRLSAASRRLAQANERLIGLAASSTPAAAPAGPPEPASNIDRADEVTLTAERIAASAALVEHMSAQARAIVPLEQQAGALAAELAALRARVEGLKAPGPREVLEAFIRANAVFFLNGTEYRDPAAAEATLAELGRLAAPLDAVIRVVGYTDDVGGGPRNQVLSQQRADKVVEDLAARGFPRARLIAVGRAATLDLAPRTGASNTNRRVEFELAFKGEAGAAP